MLLKNKSENLFVIFDAHMEMEDNEKNRNR